MNVVSLVILILWVIVGLLFIFCKDKITKFDYAIVWFVMIIQMIENLKK